MSCPLSVFFSVIWFIFWVSHGAMPMKQDVATKAIRRAFDKKVEVLYAH